MNEGMEDCFELLYGPTMHAAGRHSDYIVCVQVGQGISKNIDDVRLKKNL